MKKLCLLLVPVLWLALGDSASAATISCGAPPGTRSIELTNVDACETVEGDATLDASLVGLAYSAAGSWTPEANLTSPSLTDGPLTISFTSGAWGEAAVTGTWSIASSFWNTYTNAVIGFDVGNRGGAPTAWMFLVTPNETAGTFDYDRGAGNFGGFANVQLFGSGTASVPDGGATLALFGLALGGLGIVRRRLM